MIISSFNQIYKRSSRDTQYNEINVAYKTIHGPEWYLCQDIWVVPELITCNSYPGFSNKATVRIAIKSWVGS
jgi:hypothetical protein